MVSLDELVSTWPADIHAALRLLRRRAWQFTLGAFAGIALYTTACTTPRTEHDETSLPTDTVETTTSRQTPTTIDTVVIKRGDNLWTILKNHYSLTVDHDIADRTRTVCVQNIHSNERYARDTKRVIYDVQARTHRVENKADGIACDELEPGDVIALPRVMNTSPVSSQTSTLADSIPVPSTPQQQPDWRGLIGVGAAAALTAAAYMAARRKPPSSPNSLDDAVNLYLGNYAHNDSRDKKVRDIVHETGVGKSKLYSELRSRNLATRKETAARARDYVAEKLVDARNRGESLRRAATQYGVASSTASRLVQMYTA